MKSRFASVLIIATIVAAGAAHASIEQRQTVTLDRAAIVGEAVLAAGTYRVEFSPGLDTARFVQGKHTVAFTPCKVAHTQTVFSGDALHYRTGDSTHDRLVKIEFRQAKLSVEFPTDPVVTTDGTVGTAAGSQ